MPGRTGSSSPSRSGVTGFVQKPYFELGAPNPEHSLQNIDKTVSQSRSGFSSSFGRLWDLRSMPINLMQTPSELES